MKIHTRVTRLTWIKTHFRGVTLADIFDIKVIGFAFTMAWYCIMFFSTTIHFSDRNDVSHFNSVFGFSSLGMLAIFMIAALAPKLFMNCLKRRTFQTMSMVLLSVTSIILVMVEERLFTQPWCSITSTAAGIGMGIMYLAWGDAYKRMDTIQVIVKVSSAFLLSALIFALVVALPKMIGIIITILLPALIGIILFRMTDVWKKPEKQGLASMKRASFFGRSLLSIGLISLSASLMQSLFFNASPIINEGSYPWILLIATIVSAGIIGFTMLSSESLNFGFAYKAITFVLAFLFLLLPILNLGSFVASLAALIIYSLVSLLVWILLAKIAGRYQLSSLFVFGIGWGMNITGALAGTFGGALLSSFFELTPRILSIMTLVCVCLLFLAFSFIFDEQSLTKLTGSVNDKKSEHRPFHERCEELAHLYGLTKREKEVMILLAKGRSNPRIQEELNITSGTINTHMNHLYKKLDVHDRQELIDLIDNTKFAA